MRKLTFTKAFAQYGATLRNARWAYSAIAEDGSIVLSCWKHMLETKEDGSYFYEVKFSDWSANTPGRRLLREHVRQAYNGKLSVRLVLVVTKERAPVVAGSDSSKIPKTFHVRKDLVGEVVKFNSERFAVRFHKVKS